MRSRIEAKIQRSGATCPCIHPCIHTDIDTDRQISIHKHTILSFPPLPPLALSLSRSLALLLAHSLACARALSLSLSTLSYTLNSKP